MAQRITRSKQKIKAANIPYRIPRTEDLAERLTGVLAVLYLVFNEGYLGSSGPRRCGWTSPTEAIRLTRQLARCSPTRRWSRCPRSTACWR